MPRANDQAILVGLFRDIRRQAGLTPSRLAAGPAGAAKLLGLANVRELAGALELPVANAAITLCKLATDKLSVTDALIVDAALNLELLVELKALSVDDPIGRRLYADQITVRRSELLKSWTDLHRRLEAVRGLETHSTETAPNDTDLRNKLEDVAFTELAKALGSITDDEINRFVLGKPATGSKPGGHSEPPPKEVLVLGAAVMDFIFRLPPRGFPSPDTSVQVEDFEMHPGGKGLTQVIAASRLDMKATLVAAIGDDYFGEVILNYMEKEELNTGYLQIMEQQLSPVAGVIAYHEGTSVALGWKNEDHVRIESNQIQAGEVRARLRRSDSVLLTFELPVKTVNETLHALSDLGDEAPIVIVTPAPPYEAKLLNPRFLHVIDVLVANEWEARMLASDLPTTADLSEVCAELIGLGIKSVCIPVNGQCFAYQHDRTLEIPAWPVRVHDNTGERDALCAALAYKLSRTDRKLDREKLLWATAAMAASSMSPGVAASMPRLPEIERVISYFTTV